MKLGTVYAVYAARGEIEIEEAEIVSVGPKTVKLSGIGRRSPGLAFGCATRMDIEHAERVCAPTKAEALRRAIGVQYGLISDREEQNRRAGTTIRALERALEKEP